jgi:site-specific recombinase XerD
LGGKMEREHKEVFDGFIETGMRKEAGIYRLQTVPACLPDYCDKTGSSGSQWVSDPLSPSNSLYYKELQKWVTKSGRRERQDTYKEKTMNNEDTILNDYRRYLHLKDISSYEDYISSIKEYLSFLAATGIKYTEVNAFTGDEYRAYLLTGEQNLSRGTINNKLNRLRSFYRFLFKKRIIPANPFSHLECLRTGTTISKNILSVEDMGKLLDGFSIMSLSDWMLKSVLEFLYGSSMRISEAEALKLSDIDFDTGMIIVTNFKDHGRKWKCPATEVALRTARKYMKTAREKLLKTADLENGYLYPRHKGKTSIRCMLNAKLKSECRRLGLKPVTSHAFRHSSATHMLKAGAGIREVQMMLGHRKITSTQTYLRIVKEDLKTVLSTYHPRERLARDACCCPGENPAGSLPDNAAGAGSLATLQCCQAARQGATHILQGRRQARDPGRPCSQGDLSYGK